MLDAKIASALNKIIFFKKVSLEEQKAHKEDWFLRVRLIGFMTTFESLVLMIPFLTTLICSLSLFAMMIFRTSIRDGMKFSRQ